MSCWLELTEKITAAQSGPEINSPFAGNRFEVAGKRVFGAFGNCFWIRGQTWIEIIRSCMYLPA
jgi:hypothetical protein